MYIRTYVYTDGSDLLFVQMNTCNKSIINLKICSISHDCKAVMCVFTGMPVRNSFPSLCPNCCSPSAGTTAPRWPRSISSSRYGDLSVLRPHWNYWTISMPIFRYLHVYTNVIIICMAVGVRYFVTIIITNKIEVV